MDNQIRSVHGFELIDGDYEEGFLHKMQHKKECDEDLLIKRHDCYQW
jgi:hypothetical protein